MSNDSRETECRTCMVLIMLPVIHCFHMTQERVKSLSTSSNTHADTYDSRVCPKLRVLSSFVLDSLDNPAALILISIGRPFLLPFEIDADGTLCAPKMVMSISAFPNITLH